MQKDKDNCHHSNVLLPTENRQSQLPYSILSAMLLQRNKSQSEMHHLVNGNHLALYLIKALGH